MACAYHVNMLIRQVCVTLYDWRTFPEQFAKSRDPDEKALYKILDQVAPTIIEGLVVRHDSNRNTDLQLICPGQGARTSTTSRRAESKTILPYRYQGVGKGGRATYHQGTTRDGRSHVCSTATRRSSSSRRSFSNLTRKGSRGSFEREGR